LIGLYPDAFRLRSYLLNHVVARIPFNGIRVKCLELAGVRFEDRRSTGVMLGTQIWSADRLSIGAHSVVNRECRIEAAGTVTIGKTVVISHGVRIQTGSHDIYSEHFEAIYKPITIGDRAWVCEAAIIIGGVTIGEGAVVMAGAVVTKDVAPWTIVGGVPARPVGVRPPIEYKFTTHWAPDFN